MKYAPITIYGQTPSKSNGYRIVTLGGHGSLAKTSALRNYEEEFFWQVGHYRDLNITVPFHLFVDVYFRSLRSDLDNSLKIILDCLQKTKTIANDNLCCGIDARKFLDKENPRIVLWLETEETGN